MLTSCIDLKKLKGWKVEFKTARIEYKSYINAKSADIIKKQYV